MKNALPGLVPDRFLKANQQAFERGYEYGLQQCEAAQ
jgi:2-oxoglutarate ferredoxin oxidoreductase subunit gamma